jgi:hypothetical protein
MSPGPSEIRVSCWPWNCCRLDVAAAGVAQAFQVALR